MLKKFLLIIASIIGLLILSNSSDAQRTFSCGAHFRFDLKMDRELSLCVKNGRLTTVRRTQDHDNSTLFILEQNGCEFYIKHIQSNSYMACVNGKVKFVKRSNKSTCKWSVFAMYCGSKPITDKNDPNTYLISPVSNRSKTIDIYNWNKNEDAKVGLYQSFNNNNQKFYITESRYR